MSQFYIVLIIVRLEALDDVLELLKPMKVSLKQISRSDNLCPPARLLNDLGNPNELAFCILNGDTDLVEELLEYLRGNLDSATINSVWLSLDERDICSYLGFTVLGGNKIWQESRGSPGGLYSLRERFLTPPEKEVEVKGLPEVGILVKPYVKTWLL